MLILVNQRRYVMWHNADANRRTHRVEGSNIDVDVGMLNQKTFSSACWIFGKARVAKNLAKQAICNICNLWIFHQWHKILFQMQNCEFLGKKLVIYACAFCCDKTFLYRTNFILSQTIVFGFGFTNAGCLMASFLLERSEGKKHEYCWGPSKALEFV